MFATGFARHPLESYKIYALKRPYGFSPDDYTFLFSKRTVPLADEWSDLYYLKRKVGEKKIASFMKEMAFKAKFIGGKK